MNDWPDISEELARKSLDVFERALHKHLIDGEMSSGELKVVVDTLTDTISGLVAPDVLDTIYGARRELHL